MTYHEQPIFIFANLHNVLALFFVKDYFKDN